MRRIRQRGAPPPSFARSGRRSPGQPRTTPAPRTEPTDTSRTGSWAPRAYQLRRCPKALGYANGWDAIRGQNELLGSITTPRWQTRRVGHPLQRLPITWGHNKRRSTPVLTTRQYRPQTDGKVERFHQTMAREWGYGVTYATDRHTDQALPYHSALGGNSPISRVRNLPGHDI